MITVVGAPRRMRDVADRREQGRIDHRRADAEQRGQPQRDAGDELQRQQRFDLGLEFPTVCQREVWPVSSARSGWPITRR